MTWELSKEDRQKIYVLHGVLLLFFVVNVSSVTATCMYYVSDGYNPPAYYCCPDEGSAYNCNWEVGDMCDRCTYYSTPTPTPTTTTPTATPTTSIPTSTVTTATSTPTSSTPTQTPTSSEVCAWTGGYTGPIYQCCNNQAAWDDCESPDEECGGCWWPSPTPTATPTLAHCGYDQCSDINTPEKYNACVACNGQAYCDGLCPIPSYCNATDLYVNFVIENVSYPECNSGAWQPAVCYDNAVIRWALAGQSFPFYANLSQWKWRRDQNCPHSGHSFAVDQPYNKPIYIVAITNMDADVYYSHHAIDAEYLGAGDVNDSTWQDWKFFQYDESNISIGWGHQIPNGTSSFWTTVEIKRIISVHGCGDHDDKLVRTFYIAPNNSVYLHPRDYYTEGYVKSQSVKIQQQYVPDELNQKIKMMDRDSPFTINTWKSDPIKKELVVYVFDIKDERAINNIEKNPVGDYSIRIVRDTEFEENRINVERQLADLRMNPVYQVARITMVTDRINDPPGNYAELWVYKSTPENKNLDDTIIQGWRIKVYPMTPLPKGVIKT